MIVELKNYRNIFLLIFQLNNCPFILNITLFVLINID